jgi:ATP-binding cassette, subfamily B, bacterial MsbA
MGKNLTSHSLAINCKEHMQQQQAVLEEEKVGSVVRVEPKAESGAVVQGESEAVHEEAYQSKEVIATPKRLTARDVLGRLIAYLKPNKARFALGLFCGISVAFAQTGIAFMLGDFARSAQGEDGRINMQKIVIACAGIIVLYGVQGLLKYGQAMNMSVVAMRLGLAVRRDVYAHMQKFSLSFFYRRQTGALMATLTGDVARLQNSALMVKDIISSPIQAVVFLIALFSISWQLTLTAMIVVPIMAYAIQRLTKRLRDISRMAQSEQSGVAAVMEETLAAPRIVQSFGAEEREIERFNAANEQGIRIQLKTLDKTARLGPVVDFIGAFAVAALLYLGVAVYHVKFDNILKMLFVMSQLSNQITAMGGLRANWEEMMGAADRIFTEVLDVVPDIRDAPNAKDLSHVKGRIVFEHMSFHYNADVPVLRNINLTIEPGQVVAIVGQTGSGKSTLVDLIPRFYDPTHGRVLVDGQDIKYVTLSSLRSQLAIVEQAVTLFSGTIRDNICYGKPDATDEEVIAAAKAANVHKFIVSMPDGYNTHVGQRGQTLAGGQRQRIAIARALIKKPQILLLDEATSALDSQTEAILQEALSTWMRGRTVLIIAHRLSTIVDADKIVVLDQGHIVETGTHHELMAKRGLYCAFYETQQRGPQT